jgi:cyclophilin family peptidyl-prolyl cis-trans isomerase
MVLEVFEDEAPLAARQLLNRFREGTRETVQGTHVHRLIEDMGIFFGTSRGCVCDGLTQQASQLLHADADRQHACGRYKGAGVGVRRYSRLHHNHAGVVSLSPDGSEVAVTTAKAHSLDKDYQVVARVHKGLDMLGRLNGLPVDKDDQPALRITITSCGISDAEVSVAHFLCSMPCPAEARAEGLREVQGTHESLEEAAEREARRKETPQEAAARLQAESKQVRSAVRCMRCLEL